MIEAIQWGLIAILIWRVIRLENSQLTTKDLKSIDHKADVILKMMRHNNG